MTIGPERRRSDIADITNIIHYFFDLESEMIYEDHNDLFEESAKLPNIAARVIGREMAKALSKNKDLSGRVITILQKAVNDDKSPIPLIMAEKTYTVEEGKSLLADIFKGIDERIRNT